MHRRMYMRSIKRVIKLKSHGSLSARQIALALKIAKSTVCGLHDIYDRYNFRAVWYPHWRLVSMFQSKKKWAEKLKALPP